MLGLWVSSLWEKVWEWLHLYKRELDPAGWKQGLLLLLQKKSQSVERSFYECRVAKVGGFLMLRLGLRLCTWHFALNLPAGFLLDSTYRIPREKAEEGTSFLISLPCVAQKQPVGPAFGVLGHFQLMLGTLSGESRARCLWLLPRKYKNQPSFFQNPRLWPPYLFPYPFV